MGETDVQIIRALARYQYMTAAQASRLLYPKLADENRKMQRRLQALEQARFILRLHAFPQPRYGQAPHVFTLAQRGRTYAVGLGLPVRPAYFRPSHELQVARPENNSFMPHRLATIDVMIAADCLCRDYPVYCPQMLSERELKHGALKVEVSPGPMVGESERPRTVAVIPDAWFQLTVEGHLPVSIALELDRGTESQRAWRDKVAALALWALGPYRNAFQADNVTIGVVCPDVRRRETLAQWTKKELEARKLSTLLDIFLFTSASPVIAMPAEFFFGPVWFVPHHENAVTLLDPPLEERRVSQRVP